MTVPSPITSRDNPLLKRLRLLAHRRHGVGLGQRRGAQQGGDAGGFCGGVREKRGGGLPNPSRDPFRIQLPVAAHVQFRIQYDFPCDQDLHIQNVKIPHSQGKTGSICSDHLDHELFRKYHISHPTNLT